MQRRAIGIGHGWRSQIASASITAESNSVNSKRKAPQHQPGNDHRQSKCGQFLKFHIGALQVTLAQVGIDLILRHAVADRRHQRRRSGIANSISPLEDDGLSNENVMGL